MAGGAARRRPRGGDGGAAAAEGERDLRRGRGDVVVRRHGSAAENAVKTSAGSAGLGGEGGPATAAERSGAERSGAESGLQPGEGRWSRGRGTVRARRGGSRTAPARRGGGAGRTLASLAILALPGSAFFMMREMLAIGRNRSCSHAAAAPGGPGGSGAPPPPISFRPSPRAGNLGGVFCGQKFLAKTLNLGGVRATSAGLAPEKEREPAAGSADCRRLPGPLATAPRRIHPPPLPSLGRRPASRENWRPRKPWLGVSRWPGPDPGPGSVQLETQPEELKQKLSPVSTSSFPSFLPKS